MERAEEMATDATLTAKLQALGQVARACGLSRGHLELAKTKTRRGHLEHNDAATADLVAELQGERGLAHTCGTYGLPLRLCGPVVRFQRALRVQGP